MAEEMQVEERQEGEILEKFQSSRSFLLNEIRKVIVGQDEVIEQVLIALFVGGHCMVTGVPGLAKTLLIKTLGEVFRLEFKRIQFTPDLMPSDITGTDIIEEDHSTGMRQLKFFKGPIFTNILLADEINRTTPKTQSALLEAMQELTVTIQGKTNQLPLPFFVLATQNPIELEGTYPLPEAQLDRFMFIINVTYPTKEQEVDIALSTTSGHKPQLEVVLNADRVQELQDLVPRVPVSDYVAHYAVELVQSTRPRQNGDSPGFVNEWIDWGAGPRASQYLILGAKARALMDNRVSITVEDIRSVARQVLEHRIILNFKAEAENIKPVDIIEKLLDTVSVKS